MGCIKEHDDSDHRADIRHVPAFEWLLLSNRKTYRKAGKQNDQVNETHVKIVISKVECDSLDFLNDNVTVYGPDCFAFCPTDFGVI
jgi:hypothetical protein